MDPKNLLMTVSHVNFKTAIEKVRRPDTALRIFADQRHTVTSEDLVRH